MNFYVLTNYNSCNTATLNVINCTVWQKKMLKLTIAQSHLCHF